MFSLFKKKKKSEKKVLSVKESEALYMPVARQIQNEQAKLLVLSNDELRAQTTKFKQIFERRLEEINNVLTEIELQIRNGKHLGIEEKNKLNEELNLAVAEKIKLQNEILEELTVPAFAVMKETTRRFKNNYDLIVTSTEADKKLAVQKPYVRLEGEKTVWETAWRVGAEMLQWNMEPYEVQMMGAAALSEGKIIEMANGEGKTLIAIFPAYLHALTGESVHIATANYYLSQRDSEWMAPLFEFHGLTVGCIDMTTPTSDSRKEMYNGNIVYGTVNEFGFDYLRNHIVRDREDKVYTPSGFSIIDEVDYNLIEEARTPLTISGPTYGKRETKFLEKFAKIKPSVERMLMTQKRNVHEALNNAQIQFQNEMKDRDFYLNLLICLKGLPKYQPFLKFMGEPNIKFEIDRAIVTYDNMSSGLFSELLEHLYFLINEKDNSILLTEKGKKFISDSLGDPDFFGSFDVLSSLNRLEQDSNSKSDADALLGNAREIFDSYYEKEDNYHCVNQLLKAYLNIIRGQDYLVEEGEVVLIDPNTGRPMAGRRYSEGLHQALEAKENLKINKLTETYAIVTLQNFFKKQRKISGMSATASNFAEEFESFYGLNVAIIPPNKPVIRVDEEDRVYRTEREKINGLVNLAIETHVRTKQPILIGTDSVEMSERIFRLLSFRGISANVLNAKYHRREAAIIAAAGELGRVTISTNMAGRGTDIKLTPEAYRAGGLFVMGALRHDERSKDLQLRGRSGRQGAPGRSLFFVSLEDKLMRLFQSEKISNMMRQMGHIDGEVIQHSWVSSSIQRAQNKVSQNNIGVRQRLFEYDNMLETQRDYCYNLRESLLDDYKLKEEITSIIFKQVEFVFDRAKRDYESFKANFKFIFGLDSELTAADFKKYEKNELVAKALRECQDFYEEKSKQLISYLYPHVVEVHKNEGDKYRRIAIPFGGVNRKEFKLAADIKEAINTSGLSLFDCIERGVALTVLDESWKKQLKELDILKLGMQGEQIENIDPLLIYLKDAYQLFQDFLLEFEQSTIANIFKGDIVFTDGSTLTSRSEKRKDNLFGDENEEALKRMRERRRAQAEARVAELQAQMKSNPEETDSSKPVTFKRVDKKVGRNDPCPCGSGKRYKHCHGMKR